MENMLDHDRYGNIPEKMEQVSVVRWYWMFAQNLETNIRKLKMQLETPFEPTLQDGGQYWCPLCKEAIPPECVTFQENHDKCGHPVEWVLFHVDKKDRGIFR